MDKELLHKQTKQDLFEQIKVDRYRSTVERVTRFIRKHTEGRKKEIALKFLRGTFDISGAKKRIIDLVERYDYSFDKTLEDGYKFTTPPATEVHTRTHYHLYPEEQSNALWICDANECESCGGYLGDLFPDDEITKEERASVEGIFFIKDGTPDVTVFVIILDLMRFQVLVMRLFNSNEAMSYEEAWKWQSEHAGCESFKYVTSCLKPDIEEVFRL